MEHIAIIGMGCLFPGSETPEQFYRSLIKNKSFLEEDYLYNIKPDFFDIPVDVKKLNQLDEIFTYTLYVAHEALKSSGYLKNSKVLPKTGMIMGSRETVNKKTFDLFSPLYLSELENNFQDLLNTPDFQFDYTPDSKNSSPLNIFHFSYPTLFAAQTLSLNGPAFAIEAACASSQYAIKLASYYLLSGQTDLMIAGGLFFGKRNKALPYFLSSLGVTPRETNSRPLDQNSGGMIANEGGGAVTLKRLSDAIRDGDTIHAVIENTGWSNDGAGKFFLAPSSDGQVLSYQNAYDDCEIDNVDYIECHATGTKVGDTIELDSLEEYYGKKDTPPLFGALKGNIGHLLTAAGIASLIKVIFSMKEGVIPATYDVSTPLSSKKGFFSEKNMVIKNKSWPENNREKRAAVSSFGFGGTNSHMVLREYTANDTKIVSVSKEKHSKAPISITGMGAQFGDIEGIKQISDALFYGKTPSPRKSIKRFRGVDENSDITKQFLPKNSFREGYYFSKFDFDFMKNKVHPNEEGEALIKELILLKVVNEALEDAGYTKGQPQNVAVIISAKQNLFQLHFYLNAYLPDFIEEALIKAEIPYDKETLKKLIKIARSSIINPKAGLDFIATGIGPIIATRISSVWNFTGPSFKLCCLENSFIQSLELAEHLLNTKSVDAVLVGAVDNDPILEGVVWHEKYEEQYGMTSNAIAYGEGAAALVLKRKTDAIKTGEKIYGNIDSITLSKNKQDPEHFIESYQAGLQKAGCDTTEINYMEFYGNALADHLKRPLKMMDENLGQKNICSVSTGSACFNIGHGMTSSSAASVIKSTLMLANSFKPKLPRALLPIEKEWGKKVLNLQPPSPFWLDNPENKHISVSGEGFDGTTGHVILSGKDKDMPGMNKPFFDETDHMFIISEKSQKGLTRRLRTLNESIEKETKLTELEKECRRYLENQKIKGKSYTIVLTGRSIEEIRLETANALDQIKSVFENKTDWEGAFGSFFTANPLGKKGKLALCYPPSGLNSPAALYELVSSFPQLAETLDRLIRAAHPETRKQLANIDSGMKEKDSLPLFLDGVLGSLTSSLLLDVLSVRPDQFIGISFGELVMYSATDVFSNKDDSDLLTDLIAPLIRKLSDIEYLKKYYNDESLDWVTYFCKGDKQHITKLIEFLTEEDRAYLTIKASPGNAIISGCRKACDKVIKKASCFAYKISRNIFVHTPPAMDFYDEIVQGNLDHSYRINKKTNADYYSTHDGSTFNFSKKTMATGIANCICRSIDFENVVQKAYGDGARIFIGMDSGELCANWVKDILHDKESLALSISQNGTGLKKSLTTLIVKLLSHGVTMNHNSLFGPLETESTKDESLERSLIKTISNEPPTIKDIILTEDNRRLFPPVIHKKAQSEISRQSQIKEFVPASQKTIPAKINKSVSTHAEPAPLPIRQPEKISKAFLQKMFEQNAQAHHTYYDVQEQLSNLLYKNIAAGPSKEAKHYETMETVSKISPYKKVIWNKNDILEMTTGKVSAILGEKYEEADTYPIRARLPLPPFMFVSRVTDLDAEFGSFKPSMIEIEYDIPENPWYGMNGKAPFTIINESSHCGILLLSYIGVDIIFKGRLHFRAIDSTLTVYSERMLEAGETIKGVFRITSFIKNKDMMLAFHTYDVYDESGTHMFSIKGAGGFFSKEELQKAKGYIPSELLIPKDQTIYKNFVPVLTCNKTTFSEQDIELLQKGRGDKCFGPDYPFVKQTEQVYPDNFRVLNRVTHVEQTGGAFGQGKITGEADISPDHWVFDAHFHNDPVLPAIFMIEGSIQLLTFFVHFTGLNTLAGKQCERSTLAGSKASSKFRGEIKREKTTLRYECVIREITTKPEITITADINIFNGDKLVTLTKNMSMKLNSIDSQIANFYSGQYISKQNRASL